MPIARVYASRFTTPLYLHRVLTFGTTGRTRTDTPLRTARSKRAKATNYITVA